MVLRAGLAEVDVTPRLPIEKVGWLRRVIAEKVLDPVCAKILVLESGGVRVGFVSLDVLSVRWALAGRIREAAEACGIPKTNLMVAATHNQAGPAVASAGDTKRDEKYIEFLVGQVRQGLEKAVSALAPARIAIASAIEGRISFIRRFIMRDGSAKCHAPALPPEIRCAEGSIDPELGVLCVKDMKDNVLGFAVNFTCHPTHHGGDNLISAGYPGRLAAQLKKAFGERCVTVFLNGAFGNIHHANQYDPGFKNDMEHMGAVLAEDVQKLLPKMTFTDTASLGAATTTLKLPLRDIDGPYGVNARFPQPFGTPAIYEEAIYKLRVKKAEKDHALAEVQCLRISLFAPRQGRTAGLKAGRHAGLGGKKIGDDTAFVSIPGVFADRPARPAGLNAGHAGLPIGKNIAEYFVEHGFRIKMESRVAKTYVVGAANGMVGYVPTQEAFPRGGYETTLAMWSKLDPVAGDMLADAAIGLLRSTRRSA